MRRSEETVRERVLGLVDDLEAEVADLRDMVGKLLDIPQLEVQAVQSSRGWWRLVVRRRGDEGGAKLVSSIHNKHPTADAAADEAVRLFGNIHGVDRDSIAVVPHVPEVEEEDEE